MNWLKNGNLAKLVAFFVITIVLTCTVAYAAGGWQQPGNNNTPNDSDDDTDDTKSPSVNVDENKEANDNSAEEIPEIKPVPEFLHYITGLEITKEENYKKPMCFVFDPLAPLYSVSSAYLVAELPTEDGTRLICFTDEALNTGKIGSITPTRGYISNLAAYFGGILVASGNDGLVQYESAILKDGFLDLSDNIGYHYTEYNDYIYTNSDLLSALIKNTKTSTVKVSVPTIPFEFPEYYAEAVTGKAGAASIQIPFSGENTTTVAYTASSGKYTVSKNGTLLTDRINDESLAYDNVFILFSDCATYETSEYTESILDTSSGGTGKYATGGKYVDITWAVTADGLLFFNENGEKLTVNRGTSYISFVKSSLEDKVVIK